MALRLFGFIALLALLVLLFPARASQPPHPAPAEPEPRYDGTTVADLLVIVAGQRDVAKGSAFAGTHLLVRLETAKPDSDTLDVYLAPADFLKDFDFNFTKGDRLQVVGSKVKYAGSPIVLAREVRRDTTTVYLRDSRGTPFWKIKS